MNPIRIILIICFIGITTWLWYPHINKPSDTVQSEDDVEFFPDYTADSLTHSQFDESGLLSHKVSAKYMESFDELGFTRFENAIFTIYDHKENNHWKITSDEAVLYDNDRIELEKNVIATNLSDISYIKTIETDYIEVFVNDKKMISNNDIILSGERFTMKGSGLKADMEANTIQLINHVRTIYQNVSN